MRDAIAEVLTPHQRAVLVAITLNDVPIDVLAERQATTRGALYKTLHDARRKLRARLAQDGLGVDLSPTEASASKEPAMNRSAATAYSHPQGPSTTDPAATASSPMPLSPTSTSCHLRSVRSSTQLARSTS